MIKSNPQQELSSDKTTKLLSKFGKPPNSFTAWFVLLILSSLVVLGILVHNQWLIESCVPTLLLVSVNVTGSKKISEDE